MKIKSLGTGAAQIAERQREMERQMGAMAATIRALETRVAELSKQLHAQGSAASQPATPEDAAPERTKPEVVAAITAAATAFLGKAARVRSARLLHGAPLSGAWGGTWAQQGRLTVHTSHNLRRKG